MSNTRGAVTLPSSRGEAERLDAVHRYDVLDTPRDGAFDRITRMAARYCDVPISTITIVDTDRIWFKSTHGIEVDEIGRDPGLCASAVMQLDPYVVTDARIDPRTLDNPLVCGELGLQFYVGIPLTTSTGHNLGTLNVIDVAPREVTDDQLETLSDLAAIVVDELELRLAARERVRVEAMERAAELRDAIVAGISHEMRTPLGVLQGLQRLQEETGHDLEPEAFSTLLAKQGRHLDQLARLVQRFLDYAGLEGDQTPTIQLEPVELVPVAETVRGLFEGHTIQIHAAPDLPRVAADPARTQQALHELVANAVRFGGDHPVEIGMRRRDAGAVEVTVTDHGPGLHADDLGRVFDKTYRGVGSEGAGVGLYVAKVITEAQDGHLEVASEPGRGSTFTLVLQVAGPS